MTSPPTEAAPGVSPRTLALILGLAALGALLYLLRALAFPLLVAALVAYLLEPAIAWAHGYGVRRSAAVTALFVGIGLVLLSAGMAVAPALRAEAADLVDRLPGFTSRVEEALERASLEVGEQFPLVIRYLPTTGAPGWLGRALETRLDGLTDHLGAVLLLVVLVPIVSFFLLRDGGLMLKLLLDRLHPAHIETSVAVWCEIDRIIGHYLRGLAIESLVVGVLTGLGLWALGTPYPLLLGALAALVNPVPYVGSLISAGAACVVVFAEGQGLAMVGWVVGLYVVIRLLDDLVIIPVVIGRSVHLHPVLVVLSIVAGELAFGIVGMVLAVPTVTVIKEIARLLLEHRRTLAGVRAVSTVTVGVPHLC